MSPGVSADLLGFHNHQAADRTVESGHNDWMLLCNMLFKVLGGAGGRWTDGKEGQRAGRAVISRIRGCR